MIFLQDKVSLVLLVLAAALTCYSLVAEWRSARRDPA
jgi:hypothetical protein